MSVVGVIRANESAFRQDVLHDLFVKHPRTRLIFPPNLEHAHANLVFALTYLLEHDFDPELVRTLARDHIKVAPTPEEVRDFFTILSTHIHRYCADEPYLEVSAADRRLRDIEALFVIEESPTTARVVEVLRRSNRITIVRLLADAPLSYAPGQYLQVSSQLTQGYWRALHPSMPAQGNMLELHIFNEDDVLNALSKARPGDIWTIGIPHGNLHVSGDNDVLMIAHATGLAPMRALILDLLTRPAQPRVHLFYGAEYPGELYDLRGLWELASISPWLIVTPVVGADHDPAWVQADPATQAPRGLHLQEVSEIADAVTKWGDWADRDVLVAGPGDMVPNTVAALLKAGTPRENIQF